MTHDHAVDGHDEMRALLAAGLDAEPPLRSDAVDAAVEAGRRRRGIRMATRTGVGVVATAALAVVVAYPTGGPTPRPETTTVAADPLVGPLTLAGSTSAAPKPLRPDSYGSGSGRATGWSSEKLGNTLATLLPAGGKTVSSGDIPGRTFRVRWESAAGPVEFVGGAERTADAPKVPFCATIALPKVTPRPGVPSPQEAAPRTDCLVVKLPNGARGEAMTLTFPQDGHVSQYVRVQRADGRTVTLQQWAGKPGAALACVPRNSGVLESFPG
ncbi:hypothetical protein ACWEP4_44925 [Streptomyces sp. NPDC004227]